MSTVIPDDIAAVAAVVLGEQRIRLTGWQRDDAIRAMTALGYSRHHIAWALDMKYAAIKEYCRKRRIHTHLHDQHNDWVAIDMVVTGTARVRLIGPDRIQAIRLMAPQLTAQEIADRLRLDQKQDAIDIARRAGITLHEPEHWSWQAYRNTGNGVTTGRRQRAVTR